MSILFFILLILYSFSEQHYHQQQTYDQCKLHSDTASAKRLWSDHLMMKRTEETFNQTADRINGQFDKKVVCLFVYFSF